ncbi:Vmc-like lipoprotein signal peptide domain-containing protein [Maribacter sp. Asnod1-A12]
MTFSVKLFSLFGTTSSISVILSVAMVYVSCSNK